ncbi:heavy-metal-associated domain-containing protein [bacterium]|nr:MAG: heavy-metal-associated domain-containing protein [bacterium]MBL7995220.1 heavy-metal-associated domain-containing protein [bacterium]
MKTRMSFSVLVMLILCLNVKAWAQESKEAEIISKIVTIDVPTIKCGSCVKTVSNALKQLKGVEEVTVDKKSKTAVVKYDPSKLKVNDLETAISKSGYDANEVKRDKKAFDELDSCCR